MIRIRHCSRVISANIQVLEQFVPLIACDSITCSQSSHWSGAFAYDVTRDQDLGHVKTRVPTTSNERPVADVIVFHFWVSCEPTLPQ
jgi:hypothetical protein